MLLTGVAGFIGYSVAHQLLKDGHEVIGIDNFNDYYDVALKEARVSRLALPGFKLHRADVSDPQALAAIVEGAPEVTHVVHLAAQAGVRYSLVNPYSYVKSNVMGHLAVLEAARRLPSLEHLLYASSSSVYGLGVEFPLQEDHSAVDRPTSVYAATKRADELISHAYSHLYDLPQTGLRFFTVYGPWGRPDMAYYGFSRAIMAGEPITLYEGGVLRRDFTFIDDIVAGVTGVLNHPPGSEPRILNIGNNRSEPVTALVALLEQCLGRQAIIRTVPRPAADVIETWASVDRIAALTGYAPSTPLSVGIPKFVQWFKDYHGLD